MVLGVPILKHFRVMSMRRDYIASTSIRRHFGTKCLLGCFPPFLQQVFGHFFNYAVLYNNWPSKMGFTAKRKNLLVCRAPDKKGRSFRDLHVLMF